MKLYSTLRFAAFALLVTSTAAHATPGTITPERNGNGQQAPASPYPYPSHGDQNNQQDDGYQDGQDQNQDDGYQDDQGDQGQQQDDDWGNDDGRDQDHGDHWNHNDGKDQGGDHWNHDGKNQGDDDGWDNDGRDQGKHHQHRHQRRYVETVPVRQQFLGMARLPLYMLTNNLMNLQGARLTGIVINGYSQAGMGGAFFCSSYCSAIQSVGGYPSSYYIQATGEPINQFSGQWFLELRGNFAIDSIQLQFMR